MTGALIGPGVFVPVVGPSGSGKDSLIAYARRRLESRREIHFARRVITRDCDPASEDHDTLDEQAFAAAEADGAFALSWRSHALRYGIPRTVDETIQAGSVVVANVSREIVGEIRQRYSRVIPVLVTVSAEALAVRLAARGRETEEDIAARIARNANFANSDLGCRLIDNSGALEVAAEQFVRLLEDAIDADAASWHC